MNDDIKQIDLEYERQCIEERGASLKLPLKLKSNLQIDFEPNNIDFDFEEKKIEKKPEENIEQWLKQKKR